MPLITLVIALTGLVSPVPNPRTQVAINDVPPPSCQIVVALVGLGLLPAIDVDLPSIDSVLCRQADVPTYLAVDTSSGPPLPPPLPAPGTGSLHLVTQQLTKAVTQTGSGEVISLGSLTITETQDTTGYTLDVAFALSSSPEVTVSTCSQASSGGQPWQLQYPPGVGSGAFDYPTAGVFLQQLAADGYIDTSAVDLSTAPTAARPTDLWTRQPTFADVLGTGVPPSAAGTLVPGTLFVNLTLAANQGAPQWEVQEWNYAFSIQAQLADICPPPARRPPPQQGPPPGPLPSPTPPPSQCLPAELGASCGSQPITQAQPICLADPRAASPPLPAADASAVCGAPKPPTPPDVPCATPGACPAVLTCGDGIACPLLPTP